MKRKIMAIILCFTMVFTMTGYVGLGDYSFAYAEDSVQEDSINETSIYEQLMLSESVEEMYLSMLHFMNNNPEGLMALSAIEIDQLRMRVDYLDPEENDITRVDLLDTLAVLPNGGTVLNGNPEVYVVNRTAQSLLDEAKASGGVIKLTDNTNLDNTLIITGKVKIDLAGFILCGNGKNDVIDVSGPNAELTIIDSNSSVGHMGTVNSEGVWINSNPNNMPVSGGMIYNKGTGRGITVSGNGKCIIEGGTIAGCKSTVGSAITLTSTGHLVMTDTTVMYNKTTGTTGGAIHGEPSNSGNSGSSMKLSGVMIHHNSANTDGGGIRAFNAELENCTITHNTANGNGGGIFANQVGSSLQNTKLIIKNCNISNNSAQAGGGIYVENSMPFEITGEDTVIANNIATGNGGGVYTNTALSFKDGTVSNNKAANGGGFFADNDTELTISGGDAAITKNEATSNGGGIYGYDIQINGEEDNRIEISYNKAPNNGGGICAVGDKAKNQSCVVQHCDISHNRAGVAGGGLYTNGDCPLDMDYCDVTYNDAIDFRLNVTDGMALTGRGGGAYVQNYSTFDNVHIDNNRAMRYGGGIQVCNMNADAYFNSGTINNNLAIHAGAAAVHVTESCTFSMKGGEIIGNTCYEVGGAIHASYEANVIIEDGLIKNNKVMCGRGGAIHVDVGVNLQIIGDTTITENAAYSGYRPSTFSIESTEPGATVVTTDYGNLIKGYGGAIAVDSGTFEMTAGTISNNYADAGGAGVALVMIIMSENEPDRNKVVSFDMTGGAIIDNKTDGNGGGIYLMKNNLGDIVDKTLENEDLTSDEIKYLNELKAGIPHLNISGGKISNNLAKENGGGAYQEENTKFIISGSGDVSNNEAQHNGGGVYIASGVAEINGGTINENKASLAGGALYVGGTVTMTDGLIDHNTAVTTGGAVHIDGGDLTMTSGAITNNKATGDGSYGGGVYVSNGNVVVGVKDCDGTGSNHTVTIIDKKHPVVQDNEAKDSGGGIALIGDGNITMYCGKVITNKATNPGRGLNVYMEQGDFHLYKADIGATTDPELVIVGGNLIDHNKQPEKPENEVTLKYYHCNIKGQIHGVLDQAVKVATATKNAYYNLPDGEKYWTAEEGYRFFGWTFYGPDTEGAKENVRDKKDYKPLGEPILVDGNIDGGNDNTIHMYALWAPETSDITYKGVVIDGVYESESLNMTGNPVEYHFNIGSNVITLNAPVKDGYTFTGWYIYQDENQNANWGDNYEPVYAEGTEHTYANLDFAAMSDQFLAVGKDGKYSLEAGFTNFGNITLVAAFEPAFTDLKITKNGWDPKDENQTFVFEVKGTPFNKELPRVDMTVTIAGNGEVVIKDLPVGIYQVREVTEWSWRYQVDGNNPKEVTIDDPTETKVVEFKNKRDNNFWLSSDSSCENWWGGTDNTIIKNPIFKEEGGNVNV